MGGGEISTYLRDYLQAARLSDKDRLLRALRRLVGQAGPLDVPSLPEMLGALQAGLAPETAAEGRPLLALLEGYYLGAAFRHQEAASLFEQALQGTAGLPGAAGTYLALRAGLGRGLSQTELGQNRQALAEVQAARAEVEGLGLPILAGEYAHLEALARRRLGESEAAAELLDKWATSATVGDERLLARLEDTLGLACLELGRMNQAELHLRHSFSRKTRHGDKPGMALTLGNLGRFYGVLENFEMAAANFHKQLDLNEQLGNIKGSMVALQELARLAIREHHWIQAQDLLKQAESLLELAPNPVTQACQAYTWAEYYLAREEWEAAAAHHQAAREKFGDDPGDFLKACLDLQSARIAAGQGQMVQAETKFKESLEIFQKIKRPAWVARAAFEWGMWLARNERLQEAADYISIAIHYANDMQAQKMKARFTGACNEIPSSKWLDTVGAMKKCSQELAEKETKFESLIEDSAGTVHSLISVIDSMNNYLKKLTQSLAGQIDGKIGRSLLLAQYHAKHLDGELVTLLETLRFSDDEIPSIHCQPLKLAAFIEDLPIVFGLDMETTGQALKIGKVPPEIMVTANKRALPSVLYNLVKNAYNHSKDKNPIEVEVSTEPGFARIEVRDHGVGIPLEMQEKLFKKWIGKNTGLGLYLAKKMVESMGGVIDIISGEDKGCTFWFTVPLAPADPSQ